MRCFRFLSKKSELLKFSPQNPLAPSGTPGYISRMFRRSSAVEQLTVNQLVVGSIPTVGAITPWVWQIRSAPSGALLSFHQLVCPAEKSQKIRTKNSAQNGEKVPQALAPDKSPGYISLMFRRSSAVEQLTVNQLVVGSIPTVGAKLPHLLRSLAIQCLAAWCAPNYPSHLNTARPGLGALFRV
jgi:hypothetical protein